jgi:hypothetical protein
MFKNLILVDTMCVKMQKKYLTCISFVKKHIPKMNKDSKLSLGRTVNLSK